MEVAHKDVEPVVFEETTSNSLIQNTRCCFCFPSFSSPRRPTVGIAFWQRITTSSSSQLQSNNSFWSRTVGAFRKVREWSEIVAGPRWKTFIRRFSRSKSGSGRGFSGNRHGQFHYDPLSYALNFDENGNLEDGVDYGGMRAFSTRYASVSSSENTPLT